MSESGPFYGTFVDPILKPIRNRVAKQIPSGTKVLDIACGTGAQVFELSPKVNSVTGIDYSESMITYAKNKARQNQFSNTDFILCDASNLSAFSSNQFDYALLTLALHQFAPALYSPILNEMKRVAHKFILVDYTVPLPKNYVGFGCRLAERLAGKEHHTNFKDYYKRGGLNKILDAHAIQIEKMEGIAKGAFSLVICA